MKGINTHFIGRIITDLELKKTEVGGEPKTYCNFAVAVDHPFRKKDVDGKTYPDSDVVNITVWDKTAEYVHKWARKGRTWTFTGIWESSRKEVDGKTVTYWSVRPKDLAPAAPSEWAREESAAPASGGGSTADSQPEEDIPF